MATERKAPTVYATAAALASEPGPRTDERYAYVRSLGAMFRWELGATDTADDLNFIAPSGGSPGRWHRIVTADRGDDLTDASSTITVSGNRWRVLPTGTLTANRTVTLGVDGAQAGDVIVITRKDLENYTYSVANGGPGAGTIATLGNTGGDAEFSFDGTNWVTKRSPGAGSFAGISTSNPITNSGSPTAPIIDIVEATESLRGSMSATDKIRVNRLNANELTDRATLADATASITVSGGKWRHLPADTLTADRTVTLSATGAAAGDTITITRSDSSQRHLTIKDGVGNTVLHRLSRAGADAKFYFDGTNWKLRRAGAPSGSQAINVIELGADPTGVSDSTAAFQAALDLCAARSGHIFVPRGVYSIGDTLEFHPVASAHRYEMYGEGPGDQAQFDGPRIVWAGASGGTMFKQYGANRCYMRNIAWDCIKIAKFGIVCVYDEDNSRGSSGCIFDTVKVMMPTGSGSAAIQLGENPNPSVTRQVSEYTFINCDIVAADNSTSSYGFYIAQGGNTKNFCWDRCFVGGGFEHDFYSPSTSGQMVMTGCIAYNTRTCSLYFSGGGNLRISGYGLETAADAGFLCGLNGFAYVESSEIFCGNGADGMINYSGHLVVKNSVFRNTHNSDDLVFNLNQAEITGSEVGNGFHYDFEGNSYIPCAADGPYYTGDGGYKFINDSANFFQGRKVLFREFGCAYDADGDGSMVMRHPMDFSCPKAMSEDIFAHQILNTVSGITRSHAESRRVVHKVTIAKEALVVNSSNKTLQIANFPAKTLLHGIWFDVTQAFTGVTGPITARVTTPAGNYLSPFSLTSTGQAGLSSGDLGAGHVAAVQAGGMINDWASAGEIVCYFSAGAVFGNGTTTNLTAGSLDVYIITERIG